MRNNKIIIISLCCIEFLLIVSVCAFGNTPPSTWDLIRQEMTKKAEPNKPVESPKSVQPIQSGKSVKSVESVKTTVAVESVQSLLDKYAATQDRIQSSFIIKTQGLETAATNHPIVKNPAKLVNSVWKIDYRFDGQHFSMITDRWLDVNSFDHPENLTLNQESYNYISELWDGKAYFYYTAGKNRDSGRISIENGRFSNANKLLMGSFFGRFAGDNERFAKDDQRIDKVLRRAEKVSLRGKMEKVGEFNCYIIDAVVNKGKYTIWIDPNHGYNIAKAKIEKAEGNSAYGRVLEKGWTISDDYEVTRFEKFDGIWFPKEIIDKGESIWDTNYYSRGEGKTEILSLKLDPDHKALGSFDLKLLGIKDDAEVIVDGKQSMYIWKDGKVVDNYGYEVNLSTLKPPALMGKTLPSIAEFGVDLNPDVFKNNKLLLCFFDYSQRPSRNCVFSLNEKAQSLLDKDIFLIFIQAESVTEQTLASWLTQNKIQPPVGTSKIDLPALGRRWGVQSLPWLILTDKNHIVTDEGFGIAELDEKIKR